MKAVITNEAEFSLQRLDVIAGPETAERLGVPVGTVVRTVTFDDDGEFATDINLDDQEVAS
jgi:electron transfer flavoprotein alpha/beta subunit